MMVFGVILESLAMLKLYIWHKNVNVASREVLETNADNGWRNG
jgi:hypothetical protein